ncbi:putative T7SS-secreted protein [Williamsia sp. M5A3_1d]
MGFLDDLVSTGEDLLDAGERAVGKAVDKGTDLVGDGLRSVGLDGAADAVEDAGDTIADQLGATPDEKSLEETDDPKELVHGDAGALRDRASKLSTMAGSLEQGGNGLKGISVGDWSGEAADGYHEKTSAEFPKWFTASDACESAGNALTQLADAVQFAQTQAAEAVRLWKEAQTQHNSWLTDVNTRTDSYNAAAASYNSGATDVKPTMPTFAPDPGPALKDQANDVLRRAREHRNTAADSAAGALQGAAGQAPPLEGAASRLVDNIHDASTAFGIAKDHFGAGAIGVATDTVKLVRTVNPSDPYNMAHPVDYARNASAVGSGLVTMAAHPDQFVKSFVGTGWSKDPAKASGALTANILSLAAPGPKGAGALSGAARVGGGAAREAGVAARSAASSGARDAASAASREASSSARSAASAATPRAPEIPRATTSSAHPSVDVPRDSSPVAAQHDTTATPAKSETSSAPQQETAGPPHAEPSAPNKADAPAAHPGDGAPDRPDPSTTPTPDKPDSNVTPAGPHDGSHAPESDAPPPKPDPDPVTARPHEPDSATPPHEPDAATPPRDPDPVTPHDPDAPASRPHDAGDTPTHTVDSATVRPHDVDPSPHLTDRDAPPSHAVEHDPTPMRDPDTTAAPHDSAPHDSAPANTQSASAAPTSAPVTHPTGSGLHDPVTTPRTSHAAPEAPSTRPDVPSSRVEPSPNVAPHTPGRVEATPTGRLPDANPPMAPRTAPFDGGPTPAAAHPPGSPSPGGGAHRPSEPGAVAAAPVRGPGDGVVPPKAVDGGPRTPTAGTDRPLGDVPGGDRTPDSPDGISDNGDATNINADKPDSTPSSSAEGRDQTTCGDPVDVATGQYLLPAVDVDLPGVLPLRLVRGHRSGTTGGQWFGPSWSSTFDARAVADDEGVTTVDPDGVVLRFPPVEGNDEVESLTGRAWHLSRTPLGGYVLRDRAGTRFYWFDPKPQLGGLDTSAGAFSLSAITDRHRNRMVIGHDELGAPVSVEHSGGYRIAVDTEGGRVVRYRAISLSESGVTSTVLREFAYTDGELTHVTTGVGATTRFDYDDLHQMVRWTDSIGQTYENVYDDRGRVVFQTGPGGVWSGRYDYRDLPDGTGSVTAYTDALGATTFFGIDVDGRPQRVMDPMGRTTVRKWDVRRNPISVTDAAGATTTFDADENGDIVRVTDALGGVTDVRYGSAGRPVWMGSPDGAQQSLTYNDVGDLTEVTDAAGAVSRMVYDATGAVAQQRDPAGRLATVANNAAGLPVRVTDALGNATEVVYDDAGRPVRVLGPDGAQTVREYDVEGRLAAVVAPDGGRQDWRYDGEGNRIAHVDASGAETRWEYGFFDLPVTRVDADGSRTEFLYDRARRLVAVVNPLGQQWTYEYFADGQVAREVDFSGAEIVYSYDDAGRVASRTNGAGQRIEFTYDALGRRIGEVSGDDVVTYGFDAVGRMISAANGSGRLEVSLDVTGRTVGESWNGGVVGSRWDRDGSLTERSTPSGVRAEFSYDGRGALSAVVCDGTAIDLSRDAAGRETRRTIGTIALDSRWDSAGRLVGRSLINGLRDTGTLNLGVTGTETETVVAGSRFDYRPDGSLVSAGSEGPSTGSLVPEARFDLDVMGRVRSVSDAAGAVLESFAYDGGHNLVGASGGDGDWQYEAGRLLSDGKATYSYDGAGRVAQVVRRRLSRKPDVWLYEWDAWDRLRALTDPAGVRWEYEYDPLGRRVSKRSSDGTVHVRFAWSGTQLVEQVDELTGESVSWVYATDGLTPIAQIAGSAAAVGARPAGGALNMAGAEGDSALSPGLTQSDIDRRFFAIVADQIGMPVGLVDPVSGGFAGRAVTSLWGQSTWTGVSTPLRFPGQYADAETGLFYNLFRYYSPDTGRYLSSDPLGLAPAPNPYAYPPNPTVVCDPLGLMACGDAEKPRVGFAEGTADSVLSSDRLQHGTRHLTEAGLLPSWSGRTSPGLIRDLLTPILEHPSATFEHTLGGTRVRGFVGQLDDRAVALFVYEEGAMQGKLATSIVPSAAQWAKWGF